MKPIQMTERHQLAIQAAPPLQTLMTVPNENPLQGLGLGGCSLPKPLDSYLGLSHVALEVLEMIPSALKIFWMSQKGPMIRDTA